MSEIPQELPKPSADQLFAVHYKIDELSASTLGLPPDLRNEPERIINEVRKKLGEKGLNIMTLSLLALTLIQIEYNIRQIIPKISKNN